MGSLAKVRLLCLIPFKDRNNICDAQEPTPGSCVTVCGVSATDACTDACGRSVCTNVHQVPAWNEKCLQRCANECLRGKAAYS